MKFMHPRSENVMAFVGAFASDLLAEETGRNAPQRAVQAAKNAGYRFVSLVYGNGASETLEII